MGFNRRFSSMPSLATITEIEGIVVVDNAVPAAPTPVGTGVSAIVGEFADVSSAVAVDNQGNVTTLLNPTEVFSEADILTKFGGWDETLGEFGVTEGSGYVARIGKSFQRLILLAINNASPRASRVWRKLPTNTSATDPTPAQPIQGGVVVAGYEFKTGNNRVRTAGRVAFTSSSAFFQEAAGSVTTAGAAATQVLTGSGGYTTAVRPDGTRGVKVGDIVVMGQVGGAGTLGSNADTYRVNTATDDTHLTLEKLDGTNFVLTTDAATVYRIHVADVADSGGQVNLANVDGFNVPVRPLDATIAASTAVSPTVAVNAIAQNSSDPLSGLTLYTHSAGTTVYTAALQAPNAAQSATLDGAYVAAINAFMGDDLPEREVNLLVSARTTAAIRAALNNFAQNRKVNGEGMMVVVSPEVNQVSLNTVGGDASPGVGATRNEETVYSWPGVQVYVQAAVGTAVKTATGNTTTDGLLDTAAAPWVMALMSGLPPERSIAQTVDPVPSILQNVVGMQRNLPKLDINSYKYMKARGIAGFRIDQGTNLPQVQSEVTSSLDPAKKYIHRRRMAFFIQDTLTLALAPYKDLPVDAQFRADVLIVHQQFFEELLSPTNPALARIAGYKLDDRGGNTPDAAAAGAYFVAHYVELLSIAHDIVLSSNVGNGILDVTSNVA